MDELCAAGRARRFNPATGCRELTLWTQRHLESARRIYQRTGFELVESEPETPQFGTLQASETWTLKL